MDRGILPGRNPDSHWRNATVRIEQDHTGYGNQGSDGEIVVDHDLMRALRLSEEATGAASDAEMVQAMALSREIREREEAGVHDEEMLRAIALSRELRESEDTGVHHEEMSRALELSEQAALEDEEYARVLRMSADLAGGQEDEELERVMRNSLNIR